MISTGKLGYASSFKQVGVFSPTVGLHNNLQKCELASFAFTWSAWPSLELGSSKTYLMASQTTFLHYSCGYRKPLLIDQGASYFHDRLASGRPSSRHPDGRVCAVTQTNEARLPGAGWQEPGGGTQEMYHPPSSCRRPSAAERLRPRQRSIRRIL